MSRTDYVKSMGGSAASIDFTQSKSFDPNPIIGFVLYTANKDARSASSKLRDN